MRKKIVAGNWKMNKNLNDGIGLAKEINHFMKQRMSGSPEVILCTPFIHLAGVGALLDADNLYAGAQDCSDKQSGAYTGDISASMIRSTGADYVIIGHSERRNYHHENEELLNKKIKTALENDLRVIYCCGELLEEREKGKHLDIVKTQISEGLDNISHDELNRIIIAYEPVWAIGTGVTASADQAQEMHSYIRTLLSDIFGEKLSEETTILYGGSCNPQNASELFAMKDVDGGLIGGASLKADDFCRIIESFPG